MTPGGKVKVLDFGLAKALAGESADQWLSESPTLTRQATETGVLLGTAPYMNPEQVRGKSVDKRTDIWAFGCCLYEALTGRTAFLGETVSDTIVKVLEREPDWDALPEGTPIIQTLLYRCFQKDPQRRLRDMWDVRVEVEEALLEPPKLTRTDVPEPARRQSRALWGVAGFMGILAGVVAVWNLMPGNTLEPELLKHLEIHLPPDPSLASGTGVDVGAALVFSPDGRNLVYVVENGESTQLHLRSMDQREAEPIADTVGATSPFFSPGGQWVGFFADGKLKIVDFGY